MYAHAIKEILTTFIQHHHLTVSFNVQISHHHDFHFQSNIGFLIPPALHSDLINHCQSSELIQHAIITGKGFLSCKVAPQMIMAPTHSPQTVIVDYCGVNSAKNLHVGHIRSLFIGDHIVRYHEYLGDTVIKMNHIGDWGNQFGYLIAHLLNAKISQPWTLDTLHMAYKKGYQRYQEEISFQQYADTITQSLHHDTASPYLTYWQECVNTSLQPLEEVFIQWNISLTLNDTYGESFYAPYCAQVMHDLLQKGIATESPDGSIVVLFNDGPLMLQKSNGNYLYAMYDLAAIQYRMNIFHPDKIIYVVDQRQKLHFQHIFTIAEQMGWAHKDQLVHHSFGTILGADKKPLKSRSGNALSLEQLYQDGMHHIKNIEFLSPEEYHLAVINSLKWHDLSFSVQSDYVFDWSSVVQQTGNDMLYWQYTKHRFNQWIHTPVQHTFDIMHLLPLEKEILIYTKEWHDQIWQHTNYPSHLILAGLVHIAKQLNFYYENTPINDHPARMSFIHYLFSIILPIDQTFGLLNTLPQY